MNPIDLVWAALGFVLSLLVFSYLIGDNPLFRLAVSLFTGVTAGYVADILLFQAIYPRLIYPLLGGTVTTSNAITHVITPLILSGLLFFLPTRKLAFLGRIPLALLLGAAGAFTISGAVLGTILPQAHATIELFAPGQMKENLPENLVIAAGTITTLMYFYFGARFEIGKPIRRPGWIEALAWMGRIFLFITLGAIFAGVYTTSVTALVERINAFWNIVTTLIR
ncbi:MAG: hypothetical protein C0391_01720 [Anaerolinea sp.]|nr:hypothetical protein [Anaerolinea sp.]